jgi:hypothetical protein
MHTQTHHPINKSTVCVPSNNTADYQNDTADYHNVQPIITMSADYHNNNRLSQCQLPIITIGPFRWWRKPECPEETTGTWSAPKIPFIRCNLSSAASWNPTHTPAQTLVTGLWVRHVSRAVNRSAFHVPQGMWMSDWGKWSLTDIDIWDTQACQYIRGLRPVRKRSTQNQNTFK